MFRRALCPPARFDNWGWNFENRGFNEVVNLWHMNHCFIEILLYALLL